MDKIEQSVQNLELIMSGMGIFVFFLFDLADVMCFGFYVVESWEIQKPIV